MLTRYRSMYLGSRGKLCNWTFSCACSTLSFPHNSCFYLSRWRSKVSEISAKLEVSFRWAIRHSLAQQWKYQSSKQTNETVLIM